MADIYAIWPRRNSKAGGYRLLDTQFLTDHLKTFGAIEVPRRHYHKLLENALAGDANFFALAPSIGGAEALRRAAGAQSA